MRGPLVPAPELPWRFDGVDVLPNSSYTYVRISDDDQCAAINLADEHAITLAAAILAAAGLTTHRVIDLGGELPEVEAIKGGWKCEGYSFPDHVPAGRTLANIRLHLAFLEARAATPRYDPADMAIATEALRGSEPQVGVYLADDERGEAMRRSWREGVAHQVLDALTAARAERGES